MRHVFTLLLAVMLSFSAMAEMNANEQKLAKMMLSGDFIQLKAAAQQIRKNEIANTELLDIAAEVLLTKYTHAFSHEVDTLAWVARAIGVSENGRYHTVLATVEANADDKRLKKHADKALDDVGDAEGEQYVKGMYQLPAGLYAKESDDVRDTRIMGLLMTGELANLKQASREVVDMEVQNPEILDTIAEVLVSHHANAADHQIDSLSWAATALGQAKNGRYLSILAEVEENGSHRKLRKYADNAIDNHGDARGEQYQKGQLGKTLPSFDF